MLLITKARVPPCGDTLLSYIWLSEVYHYSCGNIFPSAFPEYMTMFLLELVCLLKTYLGFEAHINEQIEIFSAEQIGSAPPGGMPPLFF